MRMASAHPVSALAGATETAGGGRRPWTSTNVCSTFLHAHIVFRRNNPFSPSRREPEASKGSIADYRLYAVQKLPEPRQAALRPGHAGGTGVPLRCSARR